MASPSHQGVEDARDATQIAMDFLKQWYSFARPRSAMRQGDTWLVEVDVGVFVVQIASVTLDATTGRVIGYGGPS